jgi:hypothetical protein
MSPSSKPPRRSAASILRLQAQDGFPLVATYIPPGTGVRGQEAEAIGERS